MSGESVKVAVRVRPFNQREKDRKSTLIIEMQGNTTSIRNPDAPNDEPKRFSFDYSYWSHDGFVSGQAGVLEAVQGSPYASQLRVFDDLGQGVLGNAFQGYNCSLFAYGQTGSGKSYSMVGYGSNKGIVPITCDELFKAMESKADATIRYEVTFSMLEIYNEQVRDLLSQDAHPRGGLQVRQNPKLGLFYVEGLKKVPVGSYRDIQQRMDQGTSQRTVACTNMNASSSRAHTVVTITFDQLISQGGSHIRKSSVLNLVDLAGSERADSTGATGERLKEGASINRSLSALGNVISALADLSQGKKKLVVPYRDSVLTKLLQNALGGNSKTIMIAALSPADINYEETLSTLRYADRAKKIRTQAVVNENPVDRLIRELKEENERLRKTLSGEMVVTSQAQLTPKEMAALRKEMEEEIRAQLLANQEMLIANSSSWEEKLSAARTEAQTLAHIGTRDFNRRATEPHLVNLNEDPMLSGVLFHLLSKHRTQLGRQDNDTLPDICLSGLSIQKQHALITNNEGEVDIQPASPGAKVKVNGVPLTGKTTLCHLDRVLFGLNHLYVFVNPRKPHAPAGTPEEITYEFAQKEIAQAKGFATGPESTMTREQQEIQEQILEILPMVSELNAISEELDKHKAFEAVLISSAALEGAPGPSNRPRHGSLVMVKMKNLVNGNTWLWERCKFMNRHYLIQTRYQQYLDGEVKEFSGSREDDPFWEPPEDVLIGTASVFLQSLGYALDFDDKLIVTDYKGVPEGQLYVSLTPCSQTGRPLDEDCFVQHPSELLNKPFRFKVTVRSAHIHKVRYSRGLAVRYRVPALGDKDWTQTKVICGTLEPEFQHSRIVDIPCLGKEHLDFFDQGCITFCVYGQQEDTEGDPRLAKMTTKELRQREQMAFAMDQEHQNPGAGRMADMQQADRSHMKMENDLMHHKYELLVQKERRMIQLCEEWSRKPQEKQDFQAFFRSVSSLAHSTGTVVKPPLHTVSKLANGSGRHNVYGNGDVRTDKTRTGNESRTCAVM